MENGGVLMDDIKAGCSDLDIRFRVHFKAGCWNSGRREETIAFIYSQVLPNLISILLSRFVGAYADLFVNDLEKMICGRKRSCKVRELPSLWPGINGSCQLEQGSSVSFLFIPATTGVINARLRSK
jgi:hypothetical protein